MIIKRLYVALISLLTFVCGALAGPYDVWSRYRDIVINTTATGAKVSGTVTNIPILIRLANTNSASGKDVLDSALSGGADVRFASADGSTALPYQIESWSGSAAAVWVLVPSVAGNANTTIRMYWRNPEATSESNGSAVFSPSNGYSAVFHFAEGGGSGTSFTDAANGYVTTTTGTANSTTAPLLGPNSRTFSTGTAGVANSSAVTAWAAFTPGVGDPLRNLDGTTPVTMSAWVRSSITTNGNSAQGDKHIISHFTGTGTGSVWMRRRGGTSNSDNTYANINRYNAGGDTAVHQFGPMVPAGEGGTSINNWHYITSVWNGTTWTVYRQRTSDAWNTPTVTSPPAHTTIDSVVVQTGVGPGAPTSNSNPWFLGTWSDDGTTGGAMRRGWRGELDEVRISTVARSADYIRLSFETQKASANAVTLGSSAVQTPAFAYVATSRALPLGTAMTPVAPTVGGTLASVGVQPALPAGLTLDPATGVISGTPSVSTPATNYVFTATLTGPDATIKDTIRIRTAVAIAGYAYAQGTLQLGVAKDTTIAAPAYTGEVDSFTVSPALPAGLVLNSTTGAITGTPVGAVPATNYTITAHNPTGNSSKVLNIRIVPLPTFTLTATSIVYEGGLAAPVTPIKPVTTVPVSTWEIAPTSLPAGLSFNAATGTISGTPTTATGAANYTITATNVAGTATAIVNITVTAPENYGAWTQTKTFFITTVLSGVDEGQGHFPVLVRLGKQHGSIFAAAKTNGDDVRFSRPDGKRLAYEIEDWSAADSSAHVWVLVDTVFASGVTPIRIHYGNGAASSKSNGARVFTGAKGYIGVWHMGNPVGGNAQTGIRPNSGPTGSVNDATPKNLGGGWATVNGIVGKADTLPGTGSLNDNNATGFAIGDLPLGTFPDSNLTFSGWVSISVAPPSNYWRGFLTAASNTTTTNQNSITVGVAGAGGSNVGRLGLQGAATGNPGWPSTANNSWAQNVWMHVSASVRKGSGNDSLYKNGVYLPFSGSAGNEAVVTDAHRTINYIGTNYPATDNPWNGRVDEIRMSNVARSRHWTKLEYVSQKAGVMPLLDLTYAGGPYTFPEETAITPIAAPTVIGTATSFSVSPALPAGLTLNTTTGVISGIPQDASAAQSFTITAYGDSAWSTSTTISIAVTSAPPGNLAYASDSVVYKAGTVATPNVPSNSGTITSWSITPSLPAGLSLHTGTGVISGEPLAASPLTTYTVTGTGPDGNTSAPVKITVLAPSEDFSGWSHNRSITLNTSATGANVSGTVTNYPVLVRLGQVESAIFTQAQAEGADVRFSKANGVTRLPYEVVGWDANAKTAEIWVKVDTVYGNNSTQSIKMYWGKPGAGDSSNGADVFGTSNGLTAVWHMSDTTNAASASFPLKAVNSPTDTVGMVGRSKKLNGTNQHFAIANSAASALSYQMTDNYSISSWVYVGAMPTAGNTGVSIVNKGDNQYGFGTYGTGAPKYWEIMTRGNNGHLKAVSDGSNGTTAVPAGDHVGSWRHLAGTYKGAVVGQALAESLYIDGSLIHAFSVTNNNNDGRITTFDVHIGALAGGTAPGTSFSRYFTGMVDEVRIASVTLSQAWVRLDHESQKTYQALTNIGYQAPVVAYADSLMGTAGLPVTTSTPAITGTVSAALSIHPALPAGLSFNTTTGAISGTPTVVHPATVHTITASNNGATSTDSIVITVVAPAVPSAPVIVSPANSATGVSITAAVTWKKVNPPVSGYRLQVTDDATFATVDLDTVITDTSFALPSAPHSTLLHARVRASNVGGDGAWSDTISFTTIIAPPVISYTPDSVLYSVTQPIAVLAASSTGGTVASYAISPDLAANTGLEFSAATGAITGTPTKVSAATVYTIIATNAGGADTTLVKIAVKLPAPIIAYTSPHFYKVGVPIATLEPTSTGGVVTSYAITPDITANIGLTFNTATGAISGTPGSAKAATDYTIIVTGPDGLDTAVVNITTTLEDPPVIAYTNTPQVFTKGTIIVPLTADTTGSGPIDSIRVAPALPAGLTLAADGTISGTPSAVTPLKSYVISAYGLGGVDTETVVITVNDVPPVIAYTTPHTYAVGVAIDTLSPSSTSGAVVTYSLLNGMALPAGLSLNAETGKITGTPTTGSVATDYSILATNSGGLDTAVVNITVNGSAVISGQPANRTVVAGASAGFKVVATASVSGGTLSYQWRKGTTNLTNGANVAGATSDTLTLSGTVLADTGSYNVVVTSTLNSTATATTSGNATLFVNVAPVISGHPAARTVAVGASAGFKVTAAAGTGSSAGTLSYQWRKGTTNLANGANVAGATSDTLTLSGTALADTGSYNVVVTRTLNGTTTSTTSNDATLRVNAAPVISGQPANRTVAAGASAGFKVAATVAGGGTLSYQWRKGTTNLANGANVAGATSDTLTLSGTALADTGSYNVVVTSTLNGVTTSTTSGNATLFVNVAPVISGQPANRTVVAGTSAGFKVAATAGTGTSAGTVTYQWRKGTTNLTNGANVAGATSDTLTLSNVAVSDTAGTYNVVVTHTLNGTTTTTTSGNAALRVNAAPVISGQPANRTVVAGASAGFKVVATVAGGGTLSYQWRKGTTNLTNGANVSGATSDTLTLSGAALADTGSYNVVVTSTLNAVTTSTTSGNATLLVNVAPTITAQPAATTQIVTGNNLTISVVVAAGAGTSAGTLSYQWRKGTTNLSDAGNISGATSANLVISAATIADTGSYNVVVTRTLNGTTTTVTSSSSVAQPPVSIMPGSFVFHVNGAARPYTFLLPSGAVTTEKVTMSISDIWGRTLWTHSIHPSRDAKAREIVWNGMTTTGRQVSAGMYIVKLSVQENGQTTRYIQKSVTLKPSR